MEVYILYLGAMHGGFRLRQCPEHVQSPVFHPLGKRGGGCQLFDIPVRPVSMRVCVFVRMIMIMMMMVVMIVLVMMMVVMRGFRGFGSLSAQGDHGMPALEGGPDDMFKPNLHLLQAQQARQITQRLFGIQKRGQCPEKHVSTDPGEGFEVQNAAHREGTLK
jgi:hypothetical protein